MSTRGCDEDNETEERKATDHVIRLGCRSSPFMGRCPAQPDGGARYAVAALKVVPRASASCRSSLGAGA